MGKMELACYLVQCFFLDGVLDYFYIFNIKMIFMVQDLFYCYDFLWYFQYVQNRVELLSDVEVEVCFVQYQVLGKVIKSGKCGIVLIDEIDKVFWDFFNDILDVMIELFFEVFELGLVGKQCVCILLENWLIVIMIFNLEKVLLDVFLCCCVFFYIEFLGID